MSSEIGEGIRLLWRDGLLRGLCFATLLANFIIGGLTALLVLIVTDWIGASEFTFGLVMAAFGAGAALGGLVATRLGTRFGSARLLVVAPVAQAACLVLIGTVPHVVAAACGLGVFGAAGIIFNVHTMTFIQRRTPGEFLGRVSAAQRTVSIGGAPVGAVLAGALAELTSVNVPAIIGAAVMVLAACAVVRGARRASNHRGVSPNTSAGHRGMNNGQVDDSEGE